MKTTTNDMIKVEEILSGFGRIKPKILFFGGNMLLRQREREGTFTPFKGLPVLGIMTRQISFYLGRHSNSNKRYWLAEIKAIKTFSLTKMYNKKINKFPYT